MVLHFESSDLFQWLNWTKQSEQKNWIYIISLILLLTHEHKYIVIQLHSKTIYCSTITINVLNPLIQINHNKYRCIIINLIWITTVTTAVLKNENVQINV